MASDSSTWRVVAPSLHGLGFAWKMRCFNFCHYCARLEASVGQELLLTLLCQCLVYS